MTVYARHLGALVLALVAWSVPVSAQVLTTGSLAAAGDVVTIPLTNVASLTVQASGTWAGAVEFQFSADGSTWTALPTVAPSDGSLIPRTTTTGLFYVVNAGYVSMRARAVVLDSGTVTITATRGFGSPPPQPAPSTARFSPGLPLPACNPVTLPTKALGKCS